MLSKILGTHVIIIKNMKDPYDIQFGIYRTRWSKQPTDVYEVQYTGEEGEARLHPNKVIETLIENLDVPCSVTYYND